MKLVHTRKTFFQLMVYGLCSLFGLSSATLLTAQEVSQEKLIQVYPVRIDHKWGYFRFDGKEFIKEKDLQYDLISLYTLDWNSIMPGSKGKSPYRIFEDDKKVGLVDNLLRPVLDNDFKRVRPLNPKYFAVEMDSLFTLAELPKGSTKAKIIWPETRYQNIVHIQSPNENAPQDYFWVKEGQYWGVCRKDGSKVVTPQFLATEPTLEPEFFKVKQKNEDWGWGLVSYIDTLILPCRYKKITVLDEKTFAVLPRGTDAKTANWKMLIVNRIKAKKEDIINDELSYLEGFLPVTKRRKQYNTNIHSTNYQYIQRLNSTYAVVRPYKKELDTPDVLYKIESNEEMAPLSPFKTYEPLDENHIIGLTARTSARGNEIPKRALLDTALNVLLKPGKYEQISPSGVDDLFFVKKEKKWGLISTRDSITKWVIRPRFDYINEFENNIAVCYVEEDRRLNNVFGYGAIGFVKDSFDYINCIFDEIIIEGQNVITIDSVNGEDILWRLNRKGKFKRQKQYSNVIEDIFIENDGFREVRGITLTALLNKEGRKIRARKAKFFIENVKSTKLPPYNLNSTQFRDKSFEDVRFVDSPYVALYHLNESPYSNNLTEKVFRKKPKLISFFDTKTDQAITDASMLGYRPFSASKYTAFIDAKSGKMGLIDRQGNQKLDANGQAIRYTFIGPFSGGLARVCKGGSLLRKLPEVQPHIDDNLIINSYYNFINDFNVLIKKDNSNPFKGNLDDIKLKLYFESPEGNEAKWGYINEEGEEVSKFEYQFVKDFDKGAKMGLYVVPRDDWNKKDTTRVHNVYYGALNQQCQKILEPTFTRIGKFKNYIVVQRDGTPFFLYDSKGRQVLKNATKTRPFSDDFAFIKGTNKKWGFIDTIGRYAIEPQFDAVQPFSEGLAGIKDSLGNYCYINKSGQSVFMVDGILPKYGVSALGQFSEGLCPVRIGHKWAYIDESGTILIPPKYLSAKPFYQERAIIEMLYNRKKRKAVIDKAGKLIIKPSSIQDIISFDANGVAAFMGTNKKWGLINNNGEIIVEPNYAFIDSISFSGYRRVKDDRDRWGVIDTEGKLVISHRFEAMNPPSEGMVAVKTNSRDNFRYLNIKKNKLLKREYYVAEPFQNGIAFVEIDKYFEIFSDKGIRKISKRVGALIDKKGNIIPQFESEPIFYSEGIVGLKHYDFEVGQPVEYGKQYYGDRFGGNLYIRDFEKIEPHKNGLAKLQISPRRFVTINDRGIEVVPPKYPKLTVEKEGFIKVNPNFYYGLYSKSGKELIPAIYDRIIAIKDANGNMNGVFRVEEGEKVGYYYIRGDQSKEIWPLTN